jgi:serine/threonine protein kinase
MSMTSRYRILDEIGAGGMGRVNLASMEGPEGFLGWVAIKRLQARLARDENAVKSFVEEGRIAARMSHPNIASVIEVGEDDEGWFIAMEFMHGGPLREIARLLEKRGERMPTKLACRILCDAAEGLHAAHELGLVHRDVTPHNIFVTYEGSTKVFDFGVATPATTSSCGFKGKVAYMSPEQIAAGPIDRRADVFALGVVAWELTTGQRLFRGKDDGETLENVLRAEVPRPTTFIPNYPTELEQIIMTALSPNPDDRFPTARAFARAIQLMLMGRAELVTPRDVAAFLRAIVPMEHAQEAVETTVTDPTIVSGHAHTCPMVYKMSA